MSVGRLLPSAFPRDRLEHRRRVLKELRAYERLGLAGMLVPLKPRHSSLEDGVYVDECFVEVEDARGHDGPPTYKKLTEYWGFNPLSNLGLVTGSWQSGLVAVSIHRQSNADREERFDWFLAQIALDDWPADVELSRTACYMNAHRIYLLYKVICPLK